MSIFTRVIIKYPVIVLSLYELFTSEHTQGNLPMFTDRYGVYSYYT